MDNKPLFELKPQIAVAIIPTIFGSIFLGLIVGLFAFGFVKSWLATLVIVLVIFVVLLFFSLMNLMSRKYIFYKEKAEFYEGFLNIIQRTVRYNKVTDCILRKSVWDRLFGTGTIKLVTAGHEGGGYYGQGAMGGGISIQYVERLMKFTRKLNTY